MKSKEFTKIPALNKLLYAENLAEYKAKLRPEIFKKIIQNELDRLRDEIAQGKKIPSEKEIIDVVNEQFIDILKPSLRKVINATGVVLHTNLGRAPLGYDLLENIKPVLQGYSNLEFNLISAARGSRNDHLNKLLQLVLDCEESLVVNNNAAALFLALKTLDNGQEVIISRGELVEIGGSFRIPEIIEASGAKLIEVGTTNKTKLSDYERAVNENTSLILKVHKSNYYIHGFTEEVELRKLSQLAVKYDLKLVFDLGTGLLNRKLYVGMENEPDVKSAIDDGADLVTISCDKLLGGPQGGIIAGKREIVSRIAVHPLMRILRVDKMTISSLFYVLHSMLYKRDDLEKANPVIRYINRDMKKKEELAASLVKSLSKLPVKATVIDNQARCGGGTMPYHYIDSKAVQICSPKAAADKGRAFAETLYYKLLRSETPVLGILREGTLIFDVLTLEKEDIKTITSIMYWALNLKDKHERTNL